MGFIPVFSLDVASVPQSHFSGWSNITVSVLDDTRRAVVASKASNMTRQSTLHSCRKALFSLWSRWKIPVNGKSGWTVDQMIFAEPATFTSVKTVSGFQIRSNPPSAHGGLQRIWNLMFPPSYRWAHSPPPRAPPATGGTRKGSGPWGGGVVEHPESG